jgi:hypothetical protein
MTMSPIQRAHHRIAINTPIQYAPSQSDDFRSSRLLNFSEGGMCFQTAQQLGLLEEVSVIVKNYDPGQFGPQGYRSYLTRVCWIQPISALESVRFATGTRIIARSHEVLTQLSRRDFKNCDLCGLLMTVQQLKSIDAGVHLCEACHQFYLSIPEGSLRNSLKRLLLGNVV